jgi:DNA-binding beta-propeller fold protein YncE
MGTLRVHSLVRRGASSAAFLIFACAAMAQQGSAAKYVSIPLPGANGLVMLDYFAFDPASARLWVPAGNLGRVDVIDTNTDQVSQVTGFPTGQVQFKGKMRTMGPSSVTVGDGVVYVGSRADSRICVIDARTLKLGDCVGFAPVSAGLASAPDGLIYIAATRELWATSGAPPVGVPAADKAIKILSASPPTHLQPAGKIPLPGSAEGYAVDNVHGRFYTNLEETGQTVAIDVKKRAIISSWRSCEDPSGVAVDSKRQFVFVACVDHVIVLDGAHDGRQLGSLDAGKGLDNIDYSPDAGLLYAAAATDARLTIAKVDDHGKPTPVEVVPTVEGARSVVAGPKGSAYLIDPMAGRILKVPLPANRD